MCNVAREGRSVDRLLEDVERFVEPVPEPMTPEQLGEHLISLRHCIDLLELTFAADAAIFAGTNEYDVQGSVSPIDWMRHHCHMSGHAASRSLNAGEQAQRLPETVAALRSGGVGFPHFTLMAGTARALAAKTCMGELDADSAGTPSPDAGPDLDPDAAAARSFDERPLLALALEHSVGRFGYDCTHARHAKDAAAVVEEHVVSVERRSLEFISCEGGAVAMRVLLDPVGAAVVRTAIYPLSWPVGADDDRALPRRLADALIEVANHALDLGAIPGKHGERAHLQLAASVETVMGLEGASGGDLEYAGPVSAATVQRLACDASVRRVLFGARSVVIDVGRSQRLPTAPARAALLARSSGCSWPRCDRPAAYTNAHHLIHWAHGGETDLENLVLLCYSHHWRVHEGGWQLVKTAEGQLLAIAPAPTYRSWIRPPAESAVA